MNIQILEDAKEAGFYFNSSGMSLKYESNLIGKLAKFSELIKARAIDDYCKQFEPVYYLSLGKGMFEFVDAKNLAEIAGHVDIMYKAPQIPSEVKAYIERLEILFEAVDLATPFMQNMLKNALASKPDCLKD